MRHFYRNKRIVGIDFLRIICMIMILILHISEAGGIMVLLKYEMQQNYSYWVISILRTLCFCCVNCFAIISGYLGAKARHIYANLCVEFLQVLFYSIIITLVFWIVSPNMITKNEWVSAIAPISHNQYWYFTSYFGVGIIAPIFNRGIQNIGIKSILFVNIIFFFLFSVFPMIMGKEYFWLNDGYSMLWLLYMYTVGASIRLFESKTNIKRIFRMSIFFFVYIVSCGTAFILSYLTETERIISDGNYKIGYTNPFIVISAIAIFIMFRRVRFSNGRKEKGVLFFAPLTFGVYLIHVHPLIWKNIFIGSFSPLYTINPLLLMLLMIAISLFVYVTLALADYPRYCLFKKIGLFEKIVYIEDVLLDIKKE